VIVACFPILSNHLLERNKENQTPSTTKTDRFPGPDTKYGLPELQTQVLCTTSVYSVAIFHLVSASFAKRFIMIYFIISGSAAQRRLWPPVALQPSAGYGLLVHEVS
jgi:hypothetical protein